MDINHKEFLKTLPKTKKELYALYIANCKKLGEKPSEWEMDKKALQMLITTQHIELEKNGEWAEPCYTDVDGVVFDVSKLMENKAKLPEGTMTIKILDCLADSIMKADYMIDVKGIKFKLEPDDKIERVTNIENIIFGMLKDMNCFFVRKYTLLDDPEQIKHREANQKIFDGWELNKKNKKHKF